MKEIHVIILEDDKGAKLVTQWLCTCVPRVGDYVIAKISYRLVTRVTWIDPYYVQLFVSNPLQRECE